MNFTSIQSENGVLSDLVISLYEKDMKTPVHSVAYALTLRDVAENTTVLRDIFYAENGTAVLKIVQVDEGASADIIGVRDQFLDAWIADNGLTFYSPEVKSESLYELKIGILTIDGIREFFPPKGVPELNFIVDTGERNMTAQVEVVPEFYHMALLISGGILSALVVSYRMKLNF